MYHVCGDCARALGVHRFKGEEPPLGHQGQHIAASDDANQHHDLQAGLRLYEAPEQRCIPASGSGAGGLIGEEVLIHLAQTFVCIRG